jgi:hypothetical protein
VRLGTNLAVEISPLRSKPLERNGLVTSTTNWFKLAPCMGYYIRVLSTNPDNVEEENQCEHFCEHF